MCYTRVGVVLCSIELFWDPASFLIRKHPSLIPFSQGMGKENEDRIVLGDVYGPSLPYSSLVAQTVKHLPTMWETWVWSLGQEDPLEKEIATHSSTLAWRIPWTEEPGGLQSMRLQSQTWLGDLTSLYFIQSLLDPGLEKLVSCLPWRWSPSHISLWGGSSWLSSHLIPSGKSASGQEGRPWTILGHCPFLKQTQDQDNGMLRLAYRGESGAFPLQKMDQMTTGKASAQITPRAPKNQSFRNEDFETGCLKSPVDWVRKGKDQHRCL